MKSHEKKIYEPTVIGLNIPSHNPQREKELHDTMENRARFDLVSQEGKPTSEDESLKRNDEGRMKRREEVARAEFGNLRKAYQAPKEEHGPIIIGSESADIVAEKIIKDNSFVGRLKNLFTQKKSSDTEEKPEFVQTQMQPEVQAVARFTDSVEVNSDYEPSSETIATLWKASEEAHHEYQSSKEPLPEVGIGTPEKGESSPYSTLSEAEQAIGKSLDKSITANKDLLKQNKNKIVELIRQGDEESLQRVQMLESRNAELIQEIEKSGAKRRPLLSKNVQAKINTIEGNVTHQIEKDFNNVMNKLQSIKSSPEQPEVRKEEETVSV